MKVVLVTNIYAPYREPVWRSLAVMVDELHVIILRKTESNRLWDMETVNDVPYKLHILNSKGLYLGGNYYMGLYWGGGIRKIIEGIKPTHLIVAGYTAGPFIEAIMWAKRRNIPFVQWYESHAGSSHFKGGPMAYLRRLLLGLANAWCVPGTMSKSYLEEMGLPPDKITICPNTVDVHKISSLLSRFLPDGEVQHLGPARILYVGQFVNLKRVDLLLDAYSKLPPARVVLRLVGYGPLEKKLRECSSGFKGIEFMPATRTLEETIQHYLWADIVVMPSNREVWGLVMNEALAAGCYVISSSLAGVTPDLVENSPLDVGKIINPHAGTGALVDLLSATIVDIESIRKRRQSIAEWGQTFTPERTAKGLYEAIKGVKGLCLKHD